MGSRPRAGRFQGRVPCRTHPRCSHREACCTAVAAGHYLQLKAPWMGPLPRVSADSTARRYRPTAHSARWPGRRASTPGSPIEPDGASSPAKAPASASSSTVESPPARRERCTAVGRLAPAHGRAPSTAWGDGAGPCPTGPGRRSAQERSPAQRDLVEDGEQIAGQQQQADRQVQPDVGRHRRHEGVGLIVEAL